MQRFEAALRAALVRKGLGLTSARKDVITPEDVALAMSASPDEARVDRGAACTSISPLLITRALPDRPAARPHPRPARDAGPRLRRRRAREHALRHRTVHRRHPGGARDRREPRGVPAQRRPSGAGASRSEPAERPSAATSAPTPPPTSGGVGCCWRAATTAWPWAPAPTSTPGRWWSRRGSPAFRSPSRRASPRPSRSPATVCKPISGRAA